MVFIYNKQRTRSCAQLTAHLKKTWGGSKYVIYSGGEMAVLGFQSPCVEGETFQTFSSPSKDPSWIWKRNAGGDTPGLFRTALTVFVSVHCYRASAEHTNNDKQQLRTRFFCLFLRPFLLLPACFPGNFCAVWLENLGPESTSWMCSEAAERSWTKQLPPCTAAWMGSKPFPGRRQREMQRRSCGTDLVIS